MKAPAHVAATRRHRPRACRTNSIRAGVDGSVPRPTISMSKFVPSNGSVVTPTPFRAADGPAGLGQQTHVVDQLAHLRVRTFAGGERSKAHYLKAGGDHETDALHGVRECPKTPRIDTKHGLLRAYTDLIVRVARVSVDDVMVALVEMPHENAMEAGVRLPASGEEKPWLERLGSQMPPADI